MNLRNIFIIVKREYLERVRRKSFVISTILMPVFTVALLLAPTLLASFMENEQITVAVLDEGGIVAQHLQDTDEVHFVQSTLSADSARRDADTDAVLLIDRTTTATSGPTEVTMLMHDNVGVEHERVVRGQVEQVIREYRLQSHNIPDIDKILAESEPNLTIRTLSLDDEEGDKAASTAASFIIGMVMALILYMFIMLYGQIVMTSIVEEKGNRVLEVVVSVVKPQHLMLGKIVGVGAVALTQLVIWIAIVLLFVTYGLPALVGGSTADVELAQIISVVGNVSSLAPMMLLMVVFLIGGYILYASVYAAVGAAVDNMQDASQLASIALIPIILSFMLAMPVLENPGSDLAVWMSMIPATSPVVMMSRMPFGVPVWQTCLSLGILVATDAFMVWLAAKIYRTGIFMYGKKPTVREMLRWARQK